MSSSRDKSEPRFEPSSINICLETQSGVLAGYLLDVSRRGIAIDLPRGDTPLPAVGTSVSRVTASGKGSYSGAYSLGTATVKRVWNQSAYFDYGGGMALLFDEPLDDADRHKALLKGTQQFTRLRSQARLAAHDIEHLSAYRRSLSECQMRLYIQTITFSVSLAAAYFALIYYGIVTNSMEDAQLSFWRTLVATLPGVIAIAFALMISQKNASLQRVDAYLAVLKECVARNEYPREYQGWETEYAKFRQIMKTDKCHECEMAKHSHRECGVWKPEEAQEMAGRRLTTKPYVSLYYAIMYGTFIAILVASIAAVIIEVASLQRGVSTYVAISAVITLVMVAAITGICILAWRLRKGRYSFEHYIRCWLDLLHRCREQIHC